MLRTNDFAAVAIASLAFAFSAEAQTSKQTPCPECRAVASFRGCKALRDGALPFTAKVTGSTQGRCTHVLKVDVEKASQVGLPQAIEVNLGYCAAWAGKSGDTIELAVTPTAPDGKVYALACNLW